MSSKFYQNQNKAHEWRMSLRDVKDIIRNVDASDHLPKLQANKYRMSQQRENGRDFYGAGWDDSVRQLLEGLDDFANWKKRADKEIKVETLRRRRLKINSDTDGDILDPDRLKYSDYPFTYPKKKHVPSPIIKIMVSAAFSCGNSADAITTYGLRVYEIVNTLEAMGKTVELSVYYNVSGLYTQDYSGKNTSGTYNYYQNDYSTYYVKVKEAGEYVEPSRVAVTLTSFFFRRIMFGMFAIMGDKENLSCTSYLGFPRNKWRSGRYNEDIFKLMDDTLWIEPNDAHEFSTEMVERGIKLAQLVGITNETELLEEQTHWR